MYLCGKILRKWTNNKKKLYNKLLLKLTNKKIYFNILYTYAYEKIWLIVYDLRSTWKSIRMKDIKFNKIF